jgi:hypothetical protein
MARSVEHRTGRFSLSHAEAAAIRRRVSTTPGAETTKRGTNLKARFLRAVA